MSRSEAVIEQIVNQVVELLNNRSQSIYKIDNNLLLKGIDLSVYLRHGTVIIQQPPLDVVINLAHPTSDSGLDVAVSSIQEALSFGVVVQLNIHESLLAALPIVALARMPIRLADHLGNKVYLHRRSVISTHDLLTLNCQWLVVEAATIITPLAKEFIESRNINLIEVR
ncbi:PduM family microcompartment protein [Vibrio sp. 10N.222.51.C12]|uniref:PduM family microcompartment protein n=1 Tax=unclassified Vibrio TaxID=2614977 RepID=UPI000C84C25F|nr:PduM family microcompartment protein [Vibrio sp. 10N.286.48.B7]PMH81208.1 microcompartment protein PduM [Vibrio sp. 10N.286.48.B7]